MSDFFKKLDHRELAKHIHDRVTALQTSTEGNKRKFLTWQELEDANNEEYNWYLDHFEQAIKELVVEPMQTAFELLSAPNHATPKPTNQTNLQRCYLCNTIGAVMVKTKPAVCFTCLPIP